MKRSIFNGDGRYRKPNRSKVLRIKKTEEVDRLYKKIHYLQQEISADLRNMEIEALKKKSYKASYIDDVMRLIDLMREVVTNLSNKQESI